MASVTLNNISVEFIRFSTYYDENEVKQQEAYIKVTNNTANAVVLDSLYVQNANPDSPNYLSGVPLYKYGGLADYSLAANSETFWTVGYNYEDPEPIDLWYEHGEAVDGEFKMLNDATLWENSFDIVEKGTLSTAPEPLPEAYGKEDNYGGLSHLHIALAAGLGEPDPATGQYSAGQLALFIRVPFIKESASHEWEEEYTPSGELRNHRIECQVAQPALKSILKPFGNRKLVVLLKTHNGERRRLGSIEEPLQLLRSETTGSEVRDLAHYRLQLSGLLLPADMTYTGLLPGEQEHDSTTSTVQFKEEHYTETQFK